MDQINIRNMQKTKENRLVKASACLTPNKLEKWEEHKGNGLLRSNIQKGV